jgi:hypothetical protein
MLNWSNLWPIDVQSVGFSQNFEPQMFQFCHYYVCRAPARLARCSKCHTWNSTLHTLHFTLNSSHCTLHTPHFISSHLVWALLSSSQLISSHMSSSSFKLCSSYLIAAPPFSSHRSSSYLISARKIVIKLLLSERSSDTLVHTNRCKQKTFAQRNHKRRYVYTEILVPLLLLTAFYS